MQKQFNYFQRNYATSIYTIQSDRFFTLTIKTEYFPDSRSGVPFTLQMNIEHMCRERIALHTKRQRDDSFELSRKSENNRISTVISS